MSSANNHEAWDPLVPSTPPDQVWKDLGADHWGPTPEGKHVLVVIDKLSRYPEVRIVSGTSADDNVEAFDDIFTEYGYCETLTTDNGPPFNGNEYHALQQYFKWAGIEHITIESAEDPESNGLAESFMKHLTKIWHTSLIEGKNPVAEVNKHVQMFKATPHPTTKKSPAEMMFENRKFKTRLPSMHTKEKSNCIQQAIDEDRIQKQRQKHYKDKKSYVKEHRIEIGDSVLLSQKKTKRTPPYDPVPYQVVEIKGHQITASRHNKITTRDAQKWKKITITRNRPNYAEKGEYSYSSDEDDTSWSTQEEPNMEQQIYNDPEDPVEITNNQEDNTEQQLPDSHDCEQNDTQRYPTRERRAPPRYR